MPYSVLICGSCVNNPYFADEETEVQGGEKGTFLRSHKARSGEAAVEFLCSLQSGLPHCAVRSRLVIRPRPRPSLPLCQAPTQPHACVNACHHDNLQGGFYRFPHFTDQETEAQSGEVIENTQPTSRGAAGVQIESVGGEGAPRSTLCLCGICSGPWPRMGDTMARTPKWRFWVPLAFKSC